MFCSIKWWEWGAGTLCPPTPHPPPAFPFSTAQIERQTLEHLKDSELLIVGIFSTAKFTYNCARVSYQNSKKLLHCYLFIFLTSSFLIFPFYTPLPFCDCFTFYFTEAT